VRPSEGGNPPIKYKQEKIRLTTQEIAITRISCRTSRQKLSIRRIVVKGRLGEETKNNNGWVGDGILGEYVYRERTRDGAPGRKGYEKRRHPFWG